MYCTVLYLDALLKAPVAEHVEALGDDPVLFLVLAHRALDHLVRESNAFETNETGRDASKGKEGRKEAGEHVMYARAFLCITWYEIQ